MYTQCPECLTIYEISEDALQAALGIVLCGQCSTRFDALRTLSDALPASPQETLPEHDPAERAPRLTAAIAPPAHVTAAAPERDVPVPRMQSETGDAGASSPSIAATPVEPDASANDWFADIESELEEAALDAPAVPAFELDGTPPPPGDDLLETLAEADLLPDDPAQTSDDLFAPRQLSLAAFVDIAPESPPTANAREDSPDAGTDARPVPVYVRPRRKFARAGIGWAAGCLLLAVALGAQLAWAERVNLLCNPATRTWVVRVCRNIPCRLPPIKDIAKLELLARDVRPDPAAAGALSITATVRNDAAFAQPWPVMEVRFTDLGNDPVAMRRFRPTEYMPDPTRRAAGIAPGATAVIAVEVVDPGRRATGFHFNFE